MKPSFLAPSLAGKAGIVVLVALALVSCSQIRDLKRQDDPGLWSQDGGGAMGSAQNSGAQSAEDTGAKAADAVTDQDSVAGRNAAIQEKVPETRIERGPGIAPITKVAMTTDQDFVPSLTGDPVSGNYNNIPLPDFINLVFGEQLGLPYSLDASITAQPDLVTLRLTSEVSREELFRVARRTLRDFGVAMRLDQGIFVFSVDKSIASSDVPILVTGRALPEVPESHRPVFMFVNLEAVQPGRVRNWLNSALAGKELQVLDDPTRNSVILRGKPDIVEQALAMIKVLDQPHMRGKYSSNVDPAYTQVTDLAMDLVEILKTEGYDASLRPPLGAIIVLPLKSTNQLVIFAPSREILAHVEDWARLIDRRQQLAIEDGIFSYQVNNTQAGYIVDLLNELSGDRTSDRGTGGSGGAGGSEQRSAPRTSNFVVDSNRNAIIFRGSGKKWAELLPVIKDMDQLAPSVLVEVLLAEISLTDTDSSSFAFLANTTLDRYGLTYGTLGLIDSGSSAFSAVLDKAGETRAILKVLYENRRAEIRSRPRLMVKSGQSATIDVGDEIPVLTTSSQSTTDPNAPLLQDIVYRNTGVRLQIRPVVHNSGYVDIEVVQELSEAEVNETSGIDSPTIRNRSLETTVTLQDGGSILLGGLISSTTSDNETGVPVLGSLPGVGALFRSGGEIEERRELLIMIIPYVMERPQDAERITEGMINGLVVSSDASFSDP